VLSSTSLIQIASNIASDPLFMLMVLFFVMSAAAHLRARERKFAVLAVLLTIMACFQRYAGLALVITGSLLAAYAHRSRLSRAVAAALLFALIAGAPIFAWGYLHNAPVNGTVFGARLPSVPALNFVAGAEKVLYWFVPFRIISAVGASYLVFAVVLLCGLMVLLTGARRFLQKMDEPRVLPNIVFLFVYASVLVFDISYYELKGINTDRVHIIALPSLLVLISAIGARLVEFAKSRLGGRLAYGAAVLLFVVWASYPISKTNEYVRASMLRGDVSSYNSINKGDVQRSRLAEYLRDLDLRGKHLYSNGCDTTWFMVRNLVYPLPTLESADRPAELRERFPDWPGAGIDGYAVWINAEAHKTNYATPTELAAVASLTRLYSDENATVYYVNSQ
jgi:hypothetical protein